MSDTFLGVISHIASIYSCFTHYFCIDDGSVLHRLIQPASSDRNAFLEDSKEVEELYQEAALVGRSEAPPAESEVDHHYLCFVKSSGPVSYTHLTLPRAI